MNLLTKLQNAGGAHAKASYLKGIDHNWWRVFVYAYSIDSVFGVRFHDVDITNPGEPSDELFDVLDSVLDGIAGKDSISAFADKHGDLIKMIANKHLACGVSAVSFNKVHPGSIGMFEVQLAKEVPAKDVKYPCLAQLKYDGVRLIALVEDGKVTFKTRNGKVVVLPDLAEAILRIPAANYILDGEIVYDEGKQKGRTGISGAINSAMHGGVVVEEDMVFQVFDTMSLTQFNSCLCNHEYSLRFATVKQLVEAGASNRLQLAATKVVHSHEGMQQLYEVSIAMGYEGLILKSDTHKYTFKRSKDWIKMKETKAADLHCTAVNEGSGKYDGLIGSLTCKGKVEGTEVTVNVGSGLSDFQRAMPVREFYGRIVEVKYNTLIQDSVTKQWSLFLPRFAQVRIDK